MPIWPRKKKNKHKPSLEGGEVHTELPAAPNHSRQSSSEGPSHSEVKPTRTSTEEGVSPLHAATSPVRTGSAKRPSSGKVNYATRVFEEKSQQRTSPERSRRTVVSPEKASSVGPNSLLGSGRFSSTSPGDYTSASASVKRLPSVASQGSLGGHRYSRELSTSALGYLQESSLEGMKLEVGKEKTFEGVNLLLPPLKTSSVELRKVTAIKSPSMGGFGFILRKSFEPDPNQPDTRMLVHLVEPRPDYQGPLMTGDHIVEVNGEYVAIAPHERVVELIKASGDVVELKVASVPELMELNLRGAFDEGLSSAIKWSTGAGKKVKSGAGTLRQKAAQRNIAGFQVSGG